jgi:plastocyanin
MKRMLLVLLALVAALVAASGAGADTKTVQITKSGFTPASTSIQLGDTVTWRNNDAATHQVVADNGAFASPVLKTGETFSFTFKSDGKTAYHDEFAKTHRASVTVTGAPASVSLNSSAATIVYGDNVSLTGQTSAQLPNEPVTLTSQATGKSVQNIPAVTTTASGNFTFGVAPTIQTVYQAHWRTGNSPSVTVNVAPRVGFGRVGSRYIVKVTSDLTYGGKYAWIQRKGPFSSSYVNAKRVFLGGDTSRATTTLRLPKGKSQLRVFLPASQAGIGYVQGLSRTILVTRR